MENNKPKILIILSGFLPAKTYGGPPVSINNLCSLLKDQYSFYIISKNHELKSTTLLDGIKMGWNILQNSKVIYLPDEKWNGKEFGCIVREIQPDLVYLNSLFSYDTVIPFLRICKDMRLPILLAPRGELCRNAFNKKYKKIPYIWFLKKIFNAKQMWYQSTSAEETEQICKILGAKKDHVFYLNNIPQMDFATCDGVHKTKNEAKIIFFSRIEHKKNLLFALKLLLRVDTKYSINFDIYGPKEDEAYWNECKNVIRMLPANIVVQYKGILEHERVTETLKQYHCFLFPTLSENYGQVIAEALIANRIVITSDQVPWTDMNDYHAGWAIPLDNETLFLDALSQVCSMDELSFLKIQERIKKYIQDKINIPAIKQEYDCTFSNILKR